ncbi:MAG: MerR family DNA-binding transcriptional regulator [Clostridia bacterium]|nr:MerR family DNA-binding transcriptional regulator [Clostridia bacterium]
MKKEYYTIGEVSKIKDITIKALRFYDRIGLLKPHHIDLFNQYRYYHIKQFIQIDIIKAARNMDISPSDLIPYFQSRDSKGLIGFLDIHKEEIQKKIKTLENTIIGINQVKNTIHTAESAAKENQVYTRQLPDRHIITLPYDKSKTEEEIIRDYSNLDITVSKRGLINTYEVGLLFTKYGADFYPSHLFTSIFDTISADDYRCIPKGNYLCIQYSKENAKRQQAKLRKYLTKHNYTPLDVVQVELLSDLFAEETEYFELQVRF